MRKWKSGEVKQLAPNHKSSNVSAGRNLSDHWLKALLLQMRKRKAWKRCVLCQVIQSWKDEEGPHVQPARGWAVGSQGLWRRARRYLEWDSESKTTNCPKHPCLLFHLNNKPRCISAGHETAALETTFPRSHCGRRDHMTA